MTKINTFTLSPKNFLLQMFSGQSKKVKTVKTSANTPSKLIPRKAGRGDSRNTGTSVIGQGTVIEGIIKADNNIRLDGTIIGNIECSAKLVMGKKSTFKGEILAESALVEGIFEGQIAVKDLLHLQSTANIQGEVSARQLIVDIGAILTGNYEIKGNKK